MALGVDGSVEGQRCAMKLPVVSWGQQDPGNLLGRRHMGVGSLPGFSVSHFPHLGRDDEFPSALSLFGCVKTAR